MPLSGAIKGDQVSFRYTIISNEHPITLTIQAKVTGAGTYIFNV